MSEMGYCAKCRVKREITGGQEIMLKNNRRAFKGVCRQCGTSIFRLGNGHAADTVSPAAAPVTVARKGSSNVFCVQAGKLAGNLVRQVYPLGKLGSSAYETAQKAVRNSLCICQRDEAAKGLTGYKARQRQLFAQLGIEVFALGNQGVKDIFNQPKVNELISEAGKIEQQIQSLKQEIAARHSAQEADIRFNRARAELRSPDVRIRLEAISVIEKSGRKEGITYLTPLLDDTNESVRTRTVECIKVLTGPAPAKKPRLKPESDESVRADARPAPKKPSRPRSAPKKKPTLFLTDLEVRSEPEIKSLSESQAKSEVESEPKTEPEAEPGGPETDKKTL